MRSMHLCRAKGMEPQNNLNLRLYKRSGNRISNNQATNIQYNRVQCRQKIYSVVGCINCITRKWRKLRRGAGATEAYSEKNHKAIGSDTYELVTVMRIIYWLCEYCRSSRPLVLARSLALNAPLPMVRMHLAFDVVNKFEAAQRLSDSVVIPMGRLYKSGILNGCRREGEMGGGQAFAR